MANRNHFAGRQCHAHQTHALSTGDRADHDRVGQLFALFIQLALLLALVLVFGKGVNIYWLYMVPLVLLFVVFICGLALLFSAIESMCAISHTSWIRLTW